MNRNEFFSVAKLTRCPIQVKQFGNKGYALSLVHQHEGEEQQEYFLEYQGEPRYFKSMNGIETTLKEQGIYSFSVKLEKETIEKRKRETTTPAPVASDKPKK
jgi:superfamily I DNA and/or RNA helicase